VPVPSVLLPSVNVTVPLGVTVPEFSVTVAVKVTDWPNTDGLDPVEETNDVVVATLLTT